VRRFYKPVTDGELYIKGKRLYRPVFNHDRTKGCYLFSYACSTGYCRDFIFIGFKNLKWRYVDNYPVHLIEGKSDK